MDCKSASDPERVIEADEGVQCPNERKPIVFIDEQLKAEVDADPFLHSTIGCRADARNRGGRGCGRRPEAWNPDGVNITAQIEGALLGDKTLPPLFRFVLATVRHWQAPCLQESNERFHVR